MWLALLLGRGEAASASLGERGKAALVIINLVRASAD